MKLSHNGCEVVAFGFDPKHTDNYVLTVRWEEVPDTVRFKDHWGNAVKRTFTALDEDDVKGVTLRRETEHGMHRVFSL